MADQDDVVIRISAKNLTKKEFSEAQKQLDDLAKKAGFGKTGFGQFGKGIQDAAKDMSQFNPAASKATALLGGFGPAGFAAAAGIGALVGAAGLGIKTVIDLGGSLTDAAAKAAVTTDFLQLWGFAAEQAGVSTDVVTDAVTRLGRRAGSEVPEAVKQLNKLGISVRSVVEGDPEEAFERVVRQIAAIPEPAKQAAAAMGVFGDQGLQLLPLIRSDVGATIDEFRDLGLVIEEDLLRAGDELGDNWEILKRQGTVLLAEAVGPLVEGFVELTRWMLDSSKAARQLQKDIDAMTEGERREFLALAGPGNLTEDEKRRVQELRDGARQRREEEEKQEEQTRKNVIVTEELGRSTEELEKFEKARLAVIRDLTKAQEEYARALEETALIQQAGESALALFPGFGTGGPGILAGLQSSAGKPFLEEIPISMRKWELGVKDVKDETEELQEAQERYNDALQAANALAGLIGGNIGQLVGQTFAAGASLANLSSAGGIGGLFSAGAGAGGLLGLLGGIGGVAAGIGPLVGIGLTAAQLIAGLFGRNAGDVAKEAGRDIGAKISEGLAEQILKSGENAQLFLREIFEEGGLGIDRFAEEVGDLFSFFERGEITEAGLLGELKETLPILIDHFGELGETGQQQIERIIQAAADMGIELGLAGDQLERLQQGIPETTLESFAKKLGVSVEQAQALADALGIKFQTDFERLADNLNIPLETLQELGDKLKEQFGVGLEGINEILASTGLSIDQLLDKLNIALPDSLGGLPAPGEGLDPTQIGAGIGREISPFFGGMLDELRRVRESSDRLPDAIARAIQQAVAQGA